MTKDNSDPESAIAAGPFIRNREPRLGPTAADNGQTACPNYFTHVPNFGSMKTAASREGVTQP